MEHLDLEEEPLDNSNNSHLDNVHYQINNKATTTGFGQPASTTGATTGFGQPSTGLFGQAPAPSFGGFGGV